MSEKDVALNSSIVERKLRNIADEVKNMASKELKKKRISVETFDLFLPKIDAKYEQVKVEMRTAVKNTETDTVRNRDVLLGHVQTELDTLGQTVDRMNAAYVQMIENAKRAGITELGVQKIETSDISALKEEFAELKERNRDKSHARRPANNER